MDGEQFAFEVTCLGKSWSLEYFSTWALAVNQWQQICTGHELAGYTKLWECNELHFRIVRYIQGVDMVDVVVKRAE